MKRPRFEMSYLDDRQSGGYVIRDNDTGATIKDMYPLSWTWRYQGVLDLLNELQTRIDELENACNQKGTE